MHDLFNYLLIHKQCHKNGFDCNIKIRVKINNRLVEFLFKDKQGRLTRFLMINFFPFQFALPITLLDCT